jgi:phosphoglucomutase
MQKQNPLVIPVPANYTKFWRYSMDQTEITARAKDYIAKEQDRGFRKEVEDLLVKQDWKELEDRFYRNLEFGTGGLRGVIGGGYNRMNTLVVKSATQGLAAYVCKDFP